MTESRIRPASRLTGTGTSPASPSARRRGKASRRSTSSSALSRSGRHSLTGIGYASAEAPAPTGTCNVRGSAQTAGSAASIIRTLRTASGTCKNVCASSAKGAASKSRTANCSASGSAAFGGTSATAGCKASKRRLPSSTRHVRSPQTTSKAHTGGIGAARPPASNAHGVPATSMGHGCARVHSRLKTCASSGESAGARKGSISMYFSAPGNGGLLQKVSGCASSDGWRGIPPRAPGSGIPFVRSDILAARLPTPIAVLGFGPAPFRNHFDANILLKRLKPRLQGFLCADEGLK